MECKNTTFFLRDKYFFNKKNLYIDSQIFKSLKI